MRLVFDIETNALEDPTKIHSLVLKDRDTQEMYSCTDAVKSERYLPLSYGIRLLSQADEITGHNNINYDLPKIRKIIGKAFTLKPSCIIHDTLTYARLIWPDIEEQDHRLVAANKLPPAMIGRHSLEAWGFRLGKLKGLFHKTADWTNWTPEMQAYCEGDVGVTEALQLMIEKKGYDPRALQLERDFAIPIQRVMETGFAFDEKAAGEFAATLTGVRDDLEAEIVKTFPPKVVEYITPKTQIKKTKLVPFNPRSRKQIAERLKERGWVPTKFTPAGQPALDDEVLAALPYAEAAPLARLFLVNKRLGQVSTGDSAWLKYVKAGRVHFTINTNGAVTGRCTHSDFNIAQVPKVTIDKATKKFVMGDAGDWTSECRMLFKARPGWVLVGADASGLELRCLAHYLHQFDGGAYSKIVVEGDVHTSNQIAFGLPEGKAGRDKAKNSIYCIIYGGADETLGWTLGPLAPEHEAAAQKRELQDRHYRSLAYDKQIPMKWNQAIGPQLKAKLLEGVSPDRIACIKRGAYARERVINNIAGYGQLAEAVQGVLKTQKAAGRPLTLGGLDGRRIHIRSKHAALNALLQSAGALLVKKATVLWYNALLDAGLEWGKDFALVAHVHDEIQCECRPEIAEMVGKAFVQAIKDAGTYFNFRCPVTGEYKVGNTWADTH